MSIRHSVHELPARMRGRAAAVDSSVRRFLLEVVSAVERGSKEQLAGSGQPGAYPVPRRTGDLWRGMGIDAPRRMGDGWQAVVFNDAPHARAVHEGFHAYGNPNAPYYGPRRFMTDTIGRVDPAARLQAWMERTP